MQMQREKASISKFGLVIRSLDDSIEKRVKRVRSLQKISKNLLRNLKPYIPSCWLNTVVTAQRYPLRILWRGWNLSGDVSAFKWFHYNYTMVEAAKPLKLYPISMLFTMPCLGTCYWCWIGIHICPACPFKALAQYLWYILTLTFVQSAWIPTESAETCSLYNNG